jgi:molecular chaperone HtpG
MTDNNQENMHEPQFIPFKAETRQLLDILIHSLYTDRDVFIRELISNASDALTRLSFEMLTNREVQDPNAELAIRITTNPEEHTITIRDTGIGMTESEMVEDLGTIAHSGARTFLEAAQKGEKKITEIIGQFGVGFYSAFMAAEWIKVTSRSYRPDADTTSWFSTGGDTFSIEPAENKERGTEITIKLKEDAEEYTQEHRIRQIIKKHSDYIPYPIYIGESDEQVNRQTALWRQSPQEIEPEQYTDFYKQFTLDFEGELAHTHIIIDAPVQLYALLYIPSSGDHNVLTPRKNDGLQLFARKVLIQEYCQDLLPPAFRFIQGVVDSEDLPLNVSRETIQSNRIIAKLKKIITGKVIAKLKEMAEKQLETYQKFWENFALFLKEGVATDMEIYDDLLPLLRYHTLQKPQEWQSLDQVIEGFADGQNKIYYILGEGEKAVSNSPHLEIFREKGFDVLLMTDPVDPFVLLRLKEYKEFSLVNVASDELDLPKSADDEAELPETDETTTETYTALVNLFKDGLAEQVADVRTTNRLVESPARLVDAEGAINAELQHVYKALDKEFEIPKKVLEINPDHHILVNLMKLPEGDPLRTPIIEQIFENALLVEGLHPNPAGMISRIQEIIDAALK